MGIAMLVFEIALEKQEMFEDQNILNACTTVPSPVFR
jgi:hypothetical protein